MFSNAKFSTKKKENHEEERSNTDADTATGDHSPDQKKSLSETKTPEDFLEYGDKLCLKLFKAIQENKNEKGSKDIYDLVKSISNFLDIVFLSPLKLGGKFRVGSTLMNTLSKDETFQRFIKQNIQRVLSNASSTKDNDLILWGFFMKGTVFPSDFGYILCNIDEFIDISKRILEKIFSAYDKQKTTSDQHTLITCTIATLHNVCTFGEGLHFCVSKIRNSGMMKIYRKYLDCTRLKDLVLDRVSFLAAAADIMEEGDDIVQGSQAEIEFLICGTLEACKCWSGQFNGWFAFELAKVICQLAIVDSNKRILVEYGSLKALNVLAKQSEEVEQLTATKALAHLAFNEENRHTMVNDKDLGIVQTLIHLAKSSDYLIVKESAKGVLWTLSELIFSSNTCVEQVKSIFERKMKGHIMISYSRVQRPLLLKIKERLVQSGFKVWMDIEQMHDNVYDRMAEAIENASVILLAMSYSYKCSEYCRREAAYASSLKRAKIPLLVEENYKPDSWLALMTAGDYHYDFVNKPFENKIAELIKALHNKNNPDSGVTESMTSAHGCPDIPIIPNRNAVLETRHQQREPDILKTPSSRENEYKKFLSLNQKDLLKWVDEHKLPREIFGEWRSKDFVFIARMKEQAPEYYYKHVTRLIKKCKLKDWLGNMQIAADLTEALNFLE